MQNEPVTLQDGEIMLRLERTCEANEERQWLPANYYAICLMDGTRVGQCDLRFGFNEKIYYGGHIGYGVDEPYRGHHYAMKACRLLFKLAASHGMEEVIITCAPENLPSRRTCERLGGRLETIAALPEDNDMYLEGMWQVCIFRFSTAQKDNQP